MVPTYQAHLELFQFRLMFPTYLHIFSLLRYNWQNCQIYSVHQSDLAYVCLVRSWFFIAPKWELFELWCSCVALLWMSSLCAVLSAVGGISTTSFWGSEHFLHSFLYSFSSEVAKERNIHKVLSVEVRPRHFLKEQLQSDVWIHKRFSMAFQQAQENHSLHCCRLRNGSYVRTSQKLNNYHSNQEDFRDLPALALQDEPFTANHAAVSIALSEVLTSL